MPSRKRSKPNYGRRILWLGVFVLLLASGYSAGWFYLAGQLEERTRAALAEIGRDGVMGECVDPTARGYPFRIGLFCGRVAYADASEGVALSAGAFRSAGQIYDPMRLVAELDGPARVDLPSTRLLAVDWATLRASVRLDEPLPERVSVEAADLTVGLDSGAAALGQANTFEAHMRPNEGDLDLAGSFDGLTLAPELIDGRTLPPLSGRSDLSIANGVALVATRPENLRGQSGLVRTLSLSVGPDAGMTVSGPFSIGEDGLLDADLKVTIRNPERLSAILAEAFPEHRDQIVASFAGLAALGDEPTMPLKIVRGEASLGFIPLGDIPPL